MKQLLFILFVFICVEANALELPRIFSDDMVLQQELPVRVWGRSEPGASIEVRFAGKTVSTTADGGGDWSLFLVLKGKMR